MDEIRRADAKNLLRRLLSPGRLLVLLAAGYLGWLPISSGQGIWQLGVVFWAIGLGYYVYSVREDFLRNRFVNQEHGQLWEIIRDRLARLRKAIQQAPGHIKPGIQEVPKTVERTGKNLYESLRRADIVKAEIVKSEGAGGISSLPFQARIADGETNELYVLADKNVAEYRKHYDFINAKVTRTEGQCALFISALDTLRVQLLGYRLTSKEPKVSNQEFVSTVREVQLQLDAINKALDELDLEPLPRAPERQSLNS